MKGKITAGAISKFMQQFSTEEVRLLRLAFAEMVNFTNSPEFTKIVYERVLVKHLQVPPQQEGGYGAGEVFFQQTDIAIPRMDDQYCFHFGISGVSVNENRSTRNFWYAGQEMMQIGRETVRRFLPKGEFAQVFAVLYLDDQIPYLGGNPTGTTSLAEQTAIPEEGGLELKSGVDDFALVSAELSARIFMPDTAALLMSAMAKGIKEGVDLHNIIPIQGARASERRGT
ncbi:MAG: hypothetical protein Q7S63_03100 [bacterium]|nr:hypothetical protein [bacterium]